MDDRSKVTSLAKFEALLESGAASVTINEQRLAAFRELAGISSWSGLAAACGLTMETIKQVRRGNNFTAETWLRLAFGVGRNPVELIDVSWPEYLIHGQRAGVKSPLKVIA